jgi:NADH-quinone oxidoreductase subunit J
MWEQDVAFWIIALAMAAASIGVVRSRNIVHAALFLVVVLAGAAALYILLVAEFVAWVQVLIYIGAVVILFLFGIMLTRAPMGGEPGQLDNDQRWGAAVVALFVLGVLVALLVDAFGGKNIHFTDALVEQGKTGTVGDSLFRQYLVPFEVVSMLLLGALVGAVVLARRD